MSDVEPRCEEPRARERLTGFLAVALTVVSERLMRNSITVNPDELGQSLEGYATLKEYAEQTFWDVLMSGASLSLAGPVAVIAGINGAAANRRRSKRYLKANPVSPIQPDINAA